MIDDENLDKKMGVTMGDDLNQQIVALNGLAVMLQMVDIRGHVTLDAVAWGLKNLAALGVWLQRNPGIDLRLPIDEVAALTKGALKKRLERLQSSRPFQTAVEEPAQEVSERSLPADRLSGAVKLVTTHVSDHSREQPLTSEQQDRHKWGQSGPGENGDRVDLIAVMESIGSLAGLVIGLQKSIDRVWLEVRRA